MCLVSSKFVQAVDISPPSTVTDLTAQTGLLEQQIRLTWTAPGNDGTTGVLIAGSQYRIQYST